MSDKPWVRAVILDYTPVELTSYYEKTAREIFLEMFKEANPDVSFSIWYARGVEQAIALIGQQKQLDMAIVTGLFPHSEICSKSDVLVPVLEHIASLIKSVPVLGIGFGLHAIARLTGNSSVADRFEIGAREAVLYEDLEEVGSRGKELLLPVRHRCRIKLSNGNLKILSGSESGIQIADATEYFNGNPVLGIQFHPEFVATKKGWLMFRCLYEQALIKIIKGEAEGTSIDTILKNLDPAVLRRLKSICNINTLAEKDLNKERKNLLMSPFHNANLTPKLLGEAASRRAYEKMRSNSLATVSHFVKRAINARTQPARIAI